MKVIIVATEAPSPNQMLFAWLNSRDRRQTMVNPCTAFSQDQLQVCRVYVLRYNPCLSFSRELESL